MEKELLSFPFPLFYTEVHQKANVPAAFLKWLFFRNASSLTCWVFSLLEMGLNLGGEKQKSNQKVP